MADDAQHDIEFEADSGVSTTYPLQCSSLRKHAFVVIKGYPCKIIDITTSKTGKHGHAKICYIGIDIFTGRKYEDVSPTNHYVDVPNVSHAEFTVINIDGNYLSLMDDAGEKNENVKVPERELGDKIKAEFAEGKKLLVTILKAMGMEAAISYREAPKGGQ
ncbi:translation initiation factor eIF5A [Coemansia aciculifera]|uniref:Translation initiation factor eIF5A n=1 Tax=Coemansia aciculifera TaxID=417176 RepID=A0ACC1M2Z4_9FUNG|nr:translation initiation factor eIF5A [Coemansia aciculifera]KAJ2902714.1 translation initiation factor eIF5A [Coemansia aciculifera]